MQSGMQTTYICPNCHNPLHQERVSYLCIECARQYPITPWGVSFLLDSSINQASQAEFDARNHEAEEYDLHQVNQKVRSFIRLQGQLFQRSLSGCSDGLVLD